MRESFGCLYKARHHLSHAGFVPVPATRAVRGSGPRHTPTTCIHDDTHLRFSTRPSCHAFSPHGRSPAFEPCSGDGRQGFDHISDWPSRPPPRHAALVPADSIDVNYMACLSLKGLARAGCKDALSVRLGLDCDGEKARVPHFYTQVSRTIFFLVLKCSTLTTIRDGSWNTKTRRPRPFSHCILRQLTGFLSLIDTSTILEPRYCHWDTTT